MSPPGLTVTTSGRRNTSAGPPAGGQPRKTRCTTTAVMPESRVSTLQAYVRRAVAAAPPLTERQRDRLAVLLRGRARSGGAPA